MKKLILFVGITLIAFLLLSPLAIAAPLKEKNNDKFQTFSVTGRFSWFSYLTGDHYYVPSTDNVNKAIIEFDENMITYDITIGEHTYHLGTDFTYTGHVKFVYLDPVYTLSAPYTLLYPTSYRGQYHAIIDYCYDFSTSSIDGTINMQCVGSSGGQYISSLSGTGDLQNVQIKAQVTDNDYNPGTYVITIYHSGIISGWPE